MELGRAKANKVLGLAGSHETIAAVGAAITYMVAFGFPDDYYDTYASKIRGLRLADVEDTAKSVMHPDNLIWVVVVGDRTKIEAIGHTVRLSAP